MLPPKKIRELWILLGISTCDNPHAYLRTARFRRDLRTRTHRGSHFAFSVRQVAPPETRTSFSKLNNLFGVGVEWHWAAHSWTDGSTKRYYPDGISNCEETTSQKLYLWRTRTTHAETYSGFDQAAVHPNSQISHCYQIGTRHAYSRTSTYVERSPTLNPPDVSSNFERYMGCDIHTVCPCPIQFV